MPDEAEIDTIHFMYNCIAAYNKYSGVDFNDNGKAAYGANVFNNIAYKNNIGYIIYTPLSGP